MRMIDADALKEGLKEKMFGHPFERIFLSSVVDSAHTIDAVPVVRCSECKLHTSSAFYPDMLFCVEHGIYVDPNGYCYLGERKEGVDNA